MNDFFDSYGRRLKLGGLLGKGGEGEVFRLVDSPTQAAKIYQQPLPDDRARKITVLSELDQRVHPFIACPSGLVLDRAGQARGLLLPVIENSKEIHELYTPASQKQNFAGRDWRFRVHVAGNITRSFAAVHQEGLVIGDVNQGSILVNKDGRVRLIDVDSFQVPDPKTRSLLLCTVGVPEFTPPELQGLRYDQVTRTTNHDAFGLAVILFQLLMLGRHPYSGRYLGPGDMTIPKAITENRFVYSSAAASRRMQAPPHTVSLKGLPASTASLFEKAFTPPGQRTDRPSAQAWLDDLASLQNDQSRCLRNQSHYYARTVGQCPWCEIENSSNIVLFASAITAAPSNLEGEYRKLLDELSRITPPNVPGPLQVARPVAPTPEAAAPVKGRFGLKKFIPGLILMIITVAALLSPTDTPPAPLAEAIFGGIVFGALLTAPILFFTRAKPDRRRWRNEYNAARSAHEHALEAQRRAYTFPDFGRAADAVRRVTVDWDGITARVDSERRKAEQNMRRDQLRAHLERHAIKPGLITGIGPKVTMSLASFGIDSAASVSQNAVLQVPGIGPAKADELMRWRNRIEQKFVFNPRLGLSSAVEARLRTDSERQRRVVIQQLKTQVTTLRTARDTDQQAAHQAREHAAQTLQAVHQADLNYRAALGSAPR